MLKYILSLFKEKEFFPGVAGDGITENSPVYEFNEVVGKSAVPTFGEPKGIKYPYQYQYTSSSCVGFSVAKIVCILYHQYSGKKVKFSGGWFYRQRYNLPAEGMWFFDIARLASKGAVLEELLPSEGLTERQMNSLEIDDFHVNMADAFKLPEAWINLPIDFDTTCATHEKTNKPVMVWFKFGRNEFFRRKKPIILQKKSHSELPYQHSVVVIDTYTKDGEDIILIEDSADPEEFYQKEITREFFNERCTLARHPRDFKFLKGNKQVYDGSIISVQKILQSEGMFPIGIPFAENVGKFTREGLRKFQSKYGLPITGNLDESTRTMLSTY